MTSTIPSATAYAVAAALIAGTVGYFLGQASSLGLFSATGSKRRSKKKGKTSWPNSYDVTVHPDSSDEELMSRLKAGGNTASDSDSVSDEEDYGGDLASFPGNKEECKLILVVRTDLGMGKGMLNVASLARGLHRSNFCSPSIPTIESHTGSASNGL